MVSVHPSIRDIDACEWNRLAGDNAFASHGWLLTIETCWRARFEALYFTLHRDRELRAGAVCYAVEASPGVETLDDLLLGRLRATASRLGISFLPALVCGPVQGYGWHIGIDPRLDATAQDSIRGEMLDAIEAEADRRGLRLSFVQTLDEEPELRALLAERRYLSSRNVPVALMEIPWRSLEEYFAHLPGKRRREFRREMRRNIEGGTRIEIVESGVGWEDRFLALFEGNARRHGLVNLPFGRQLFSELHKNMGDGALMFVARKNGAVSGVYLVLQRKESAIAFEVGVDAEMGGDDFTYFRLVYYWLIEYAIEHGIERIYFGRGMYEIKLRRGCGLTGSWVYTRMTGRHRALSAPWYAIASWWNRYKLQPEVRRQLGLPGKPPKMESGEQR